MKKRNFIICDARQINAEFNESGRLELCVALAGEWKSRDMKVTQAHLQQMADNFAKEGKDLLFDYDHKCLDFFGADSKAAGWGKSVRLEDGKLYVEMEPTPRGKALIESGEYKYLSPVYEYMRLDRVTGKKLKDWRLHSVALTNTPFLTELPAIKNMEGGPQVDELLKLLGADDEASAIEKVKEMQANSTKLEADKTALAEEKGKLESKLNEQEVELAINSHKLLPSQKALALKLLNSDRALYEEFLAGSAPKDLTKEVPVEAGENRTAKNELDKVESFSDLINNDELAAKMEAEQPERYEALYNKYLKEGK